ncbi:MAG TPA: hypothetical protein VI248_01415 [Kineosporiaceae bacterium]
MTTIPLRAASTRGGPAVAGPLLRSPLLVWAAIYGNVLTFLGPTPLIPIPTPLGQAIAQGMLPLALILTLLANPGLVLRLNVPMALLTVLSVLALAVSIHNDFLVGSAYRAVRLVLFVLVLWPLTPWWGHADRPLLRAHLRCLRVVTVSVLMGAVVAPGAAFSEEGRLRGAIWPIPPPQVAHYAAVLLGCTIVLWFVGEVGGRTTLVTVAGAGAALIESHTRTALAAMLLGIIVAGASLFLRHPRVRHAAAVTALVAGLAAGLAGPWILAWLSRGQDAQQASQLTGRTKVWTAVANAPRTWVQAAFGTGLSNKSYNGLPIDSNWVATFLELGWVGIAVQVVLLAFLAGWALARRGTEGAIALFIVTYCLVASFTETGLGDASPYLLELVVAGSVLARPAWTRADVL